MSSQPKPRVAIGPRSVAFAEAAVEAGGGQLVGVGDHPDALVWVSPRHLPELSRVVAETPTLRWVQLPLAGVERHFAAGVFDTSRVWTCAKGSYAQPVAEHAMALALAGLRRLHERVVAKTWGEPAGTTLYGADVAILGGGGIAQELLRLLEPYGVHSTVVRRSPEPLSTATRTVGQGSLIEAVTSATVVFVALALTDDTRSIVDADVLRAIGPGGWLVNVARGAHVDTAALVSALQDGAIAGAALDVTDPEPLPDGHPLWNAPNCIITPHTADTQEMVEPLLATRIASNVARFAAGETLEGLVDPEIGY
ncbi:MAG: D-isomer specific 2-hydroxyacid dehydrogenase family protein [Acidimicrobiales bacterium]